MSRRLRDPVHGLIVFEEGNKIDMLAWSLVDAPEFQRLRRIRQLGVSELTFPGAVHTRFSHSIGVFHTARQLVTVLRRELTRNQKSFDEPRAESALVAALLHDLGHGPFSHTFEEVQASREVSKRHEKWTADIIRNQDGQIFPILERHRSGLADDVAGMLEREDPEDIYHAVVSSSFDADRLDYLRRDKLMTGTGAGGIDFDWLIDNLRVAEIGLDVPDDENGASRRVQTFCLTAKALPAAEQFLLARYTLHQQVYFHKATRCAEQMIGKLLRAIARLAASGKIVDSNLPDNHPLARFFSESGETVCNYLALDDSVVLGALDAMSRATEPSVRDLARRLQERRLYKTLDISEFGEDAGKQRARKRRIEERFAAKITDETVMLDEGASISIYAEIGGDEERMHKKLHILDGSTPVEISKLSELIRSLERKKQFTRFYFADVADRDAARN